jgi:hypothetical protein
MSTDSSPAVESEYVKATRQQVRNMIAELAQLAKSEVAPNEFYEALLGRAVSALVAIGGVVWTINDEGGLEVAYQINIQASGLMNDREAQKRHYHLLHKAVNEPEGMLVAPHSGADDDEEAGNPTEFLLILAPLTRDRNQHGLIEIFQRTGAGPVTQRGYLRFVMQLCELAGNYLNTRQLRHFEDRQTLWGQLEQFTKSVHESLDPKQTAYRVVNEGRRLIECDRVTLAVRHGRKCHVEAISHQDQIDKRSNVASLLSRLATRVAATGDPVWYTGSTEDMPPQVEDAVHEYVDESHAKVVGVLPLFRPEDPDEADDDQDRRKPQEVLGTLIVEQFDNSRLENRTMQRVDVVKDHAASALSNALEHNNLFLMPVWRTIGRWKWVVSARTLPKTIAVLIVVAGLVACLFIPSPFELEARGTLRPAIRQDVFVREGGLVTDVFVQHGSGVNTGDRLLQLTSLDLEGEITKIIGEQKATGEQIEWLRDSLARNKSRMSRGDLDRLNGRLMELKKRFESYTNEVEVLQRKQSLLLLTSPLDGQVITWDVQRRLLRRTVAPGQLLMSIADPGGPWELEVFMPDSRMDHVQRRQTELANENQPLGVTYILATDPENELTGSVQEIQTSAEVREQHGNSVLIRVKIDRDQIDAAELRDGTEVTAKVDCGYRPLGYVWFHDLIAWFQKNVLFRL